MRIGAEEEARFRREWGESWPRVWAAANWFSRNGFTEVEVTPPRLRPNFEQREGYGDEYDILLDGQIRVEVKGRKRNYAFTGVGDFPYRTIYVDRVRKVDTTPCSIYVIVDNDLSHCGLVYLDTKPSWSKKETYDPVKGHRLHVYECPKELVEFHSLEEL